MDEWLHFLDIFSVRAFVAMHMLHAMYQMRTLLRWDCEFAAGFAPYQHPAC